MRPEDFYIHQLSTRHKQNVLEKSGLVKLEFDDPFRVISQISTELFAARGLAVPTKEQLAAFAEQERLAKAAEEDDDVVEIIDQS